MKAPKHLVNAMELTTCRNAVKTCMEFSPQEDGATILSGLGGPYIFTYLWGGLAKWGFKIFLTYGGTKDKVC